MDPDSPPEAMLSTLELYSPHIVYTKMLCGSDLTLKLESFYRRSCPRFQNFRRLCIELESDGTGLDIHMITIFNEYIEILETSISAYLAEIGVTFERFLLSVKMNMEKMEDCVFNLLSLFDKVFSFIAFGEMMEEKAVQLYGKRKVDSDETDTQMVSSGNFYF